MKIITRNEAMAMAERLKRHYSIREMVIAGYEPLTVNGNHLWKPPAIRPGELGRPQLTEEQIAVIIRLGTHEDTTK